MSKRCITCSEVVNYNISTGYYRLISQIMEEEIKYIQGYKSLINDYFKKALTLQVNSGTKLAKLPDDFANATWLDPAPILKITQLIPKIIQKQIENIKIFIDEIEKSLSNLENHIKNKSLEMKKYQQKYDEVSNDLINKYEEIDKAEKSFTNSIKKTEELIIEIHKNKRKIQNVKNGKIKMNDNELKVLNDKTKEYESQKESLINVTKKYEKEYKNIIKNSSTTKYENKFATVINDCINGVKSVCGELTDKAKDTIICFLSSIRDSFKVPLDLVDSNLSMMKNLDEKEIISKTMEDTFNNQCKFTHITPEIYNLKSLEITSIERTSKGSKGNKKKKKKKKEENEDNNENGFIKFEDGFEEMTYFEDDLTLLTVKEMFNNFDLINRNGLDIKIEEEKNEAKKYINRLLLNMSKEENSKNFDDFNIIEIDDCEPFGDEDKNVFQTLLNRHHNRVIFLHKLNDYRTCSLLEVKERMYNILGDLFTYLIDISKIEKDYHSIEMTIILSKTYYKLENKKKIYLQNFIKNNECFKTKDFWEELLLYSMSKEIIRSKKNDDDNKKEDEKVLKEKNSNIVFSQLLSLIDNMFDFEVDGEKIKQIIEYRVDYYKLDDKLKKTINDVVNSKLKSKK